VSRQDTVGWESQVRPRRFYLERASQGIALQTRVEVSQLSVFGLQSRGAMQPYRYALVTCFWKRV
jgi:hypothetical protein